MSTEQPPKDSGKTPPTQQPLLGGARIPVNIEDEMRRSYLDYAMSVIIGRALPDVRDGLKPVHRRILFGMSEMGLQHNKSYRKCAKIVGEVMGNFHPHGDAAIYDTLVRMAQDFSMRYPLIDGQGNFGSIDGDPPAAMRYTESRLARISELLLEDIDKETVDFTPNYDESLREPTYLPARLPNLLVNGSSGIAVGMATNIPPHNLAEIVEATIALIENSEITLKDLMKKVPGPDFPTGGFIYGKEGIKKAFADGRGTIVMRARAAVEHLTKDKDAIVITEIPYMVNKAKLIEKIADLVQEKKIEGISDLRDESDREGMRIVVELRRGEPAEVILNNLYKQTPMQSTFGVIMLSIVNGQPQVLNLKTMLQYFVDHRINVVRRRTQFELRKAEDRAHILEGLKIAIDNIDAVVKLIRSCKTPKEAREGLMTRFKLSERQAQAILELTLQRLTGLERAKILQEYEDLIKLIETLRGILASEKKVRGLVVEELEEMKKTYGDVRRTQIIDEQAEITLEDLIVQEDVAITLTHGGYLKRTPIALYRTQTRGGKGRIGMRTREEDFVEHMFIASTHSYLLIFTNKGRVYWLKVYEIPDVGTAGKGKAIANLVNLSPGEKVSAVLPVLKLDAEDNEQKSVVMATQLGVIKKTPLSAFANPMSRGIIAINLDSNDELIGCKLTDGKQVIFLATHDGKAIRFGEEEVRDMGRQAHGVRGMRLGKGDFVVSMEAAGAKDLILSVTERGYGKRTSIEEYRLTGRGGKGVINVKTAERNGKVVGALSVEEDSQVILITAQGKIIRTDSSQIREAGRSTQGVRLIDLESDDRVAAASRIEENGEVENGSGE
ncbi:MAG: DNA gyrase subunit A [Acidobacteriia bacterium]|nr:DNA gyrase subunit A [Terriglobia bacterium]